MRVSSYSKRQSIEQVEEGVDLAPKFSVDVQGEACCHVGYRSCFYRAVPVSDQAGQPLKFTETQKAFDPQTIYGDAPNPTQL